jgi:hypothetical protein
MAAARATRFEAVQDGGMKAQPILVVAGLLLLGCGLAALFAPGEMAGFLGSRGQPTSAVVIQLLGGALFALGFLDWFSRFSAIGGIHGRPVLVANLSFFFIAATTLLRHALGSEGTAVAWLPAGVAGALAAWFGRLLFFPQAPR